MKTSFKMFCEALPESVEAWKKYLMTVFGISGGSIYAGEVPYRILAKAKRFLDDATIKEIVITSLLKRLKDADERDEYLSVRNIIDHIQHEANTYPEFRYPELKPIEKSVQIELKRNPEW